MMRNVERDCLLGGKNKKVDGDGVIWQRRPNGCLISICKYVKKLCIPIHLVDDLKKHLLGILLLVCTPKSSVMEL